MKKLSYSTKNKLLILTGAVLLLLSWNLAFKKTYEAILLNGKLTRASLQSQDLSSNPEYLKRKETALTHILNRYSVDDPDWKNEFWLNVSGVAASRGLQVIYLPNQYGAASDSTQLPTLQQSIQFQGNYKGLVQLLDTLENSKGVGKIISARFEKVRRNFSDKAKGMIVLRTDFRAIQKGEE